MVLTYVCRNSFDDMRVWNKKKINQKGWRECNEEEREDIVDSRDKCSGDGSEKKQLRQE